MKKDFDKWKKDAKDRVNKLKHGVLTEDEVYEWLIKTSNIRRNNGTNKVLFYK